MPSLKLVFVFSLRSVLNFCGCWWPLTYILCYHLLRSLFNEISFSIQKKKKTLGSFILKKSMQRKQMCSHLGMVDSFDSDFMLHYVTSVENLLNFISHWFHSSCLYAMKRNWSWISRMPVKLILALSWLEKYHYAWIDSEYL